MRNSIKRLCKVKDTNIYTLLLVKGAAKILMSYLELTWLRVTRTSLPKTLLGIGQHLVAIKVVHDLVMYDMFRDREFQSEMIG